MDLNIKLEVDTLRGGLLESKSRVLAVVLGPSSDGEEQLRFQSGDPFSKVFWRSAAKFVQALALFSSGAADKFALTEDELALCCASHSGGDVHVAKVAALLQKLGLKEDDLHCAPHPPLGAAEEKALASRGVAPTRLHNNCSGKHTGMLAACLARGWPAVDYDRLHHPLQQEILGHLSAISAIPLSDIETAVDGCGAVVFRTPLIGLARAYRRLVSRTLPAPYRQAGERLLQAMRAAPAMIAGPGRLCTNLICATQGQVVGKVGADGIYGLGVDRQGGFGLAIKIEDGNSRHVEQVVCELLAHLGGITEDERAALRPHWQRPIYNHQRELVGEVVVRIER